MMSNETQIEVTPVEDLMREHGLLNRVLLIYDEIMNRLNNQIDFDIKLVTQSAMIIQKFIEEYHEEMEEKYVFSVLLEHNLQTSLVNELWEQHDLGRILTQLIIDLSKYRPVPEITNKLKLYIGTFVKAYRYHEAQEDTIIFPLFKTLISHQKYDELTEIFEKVEKEKFGANGFEKILEQVISIEKKLDINNPRKITLSIENIFI